MIERFPHTKHVYYNFDSVEDDPRNDYRHDFFS
jgi:ATP-dependent DNA helicase PIF1